MRTRSVCLVAVLIAGCLGCKRDKTSEQVAAMNTSNIQRITNMYEAFQNMKSAGGPKDEAELKAWIREYDPKKLEMMKIDTNNLDALFTSERDNKPFKVRYKVGGSRGAVAPVVFESEGVNGLKQVAFTGGKVEDADDATYQRYWSGKAGSVGAATPTGPTGGKDGGRPIGSGAPAGAPTGPPGK